MAAHERLKVVLFSGGRGTGSISDALLKYPDIELITLVNAYDDGKSTGLLRRYIPGMLGPSDIRKVISTLLKHKPDRSSQALRTLMEYRFDDATTEAQAMPVLQALIAWSPASANPHEVVQAKEQLTLAQMRQVSEYLQAFLDYYHTHPAEWFTFGDNGLGNLLFAGCYLLERRDFNRAIDAFSAFAEVSGVVNVTLGENYVLTALKENGVYLPRESDIVSPQDASRIEEIFLLPDYIEAAAVDAKASKDQKIAFLREQERLPKLNPVAATALREADIIIYGPGTQHSSLYPSYLTEGVAEAIQANTHAEKIFIGNIARDYDILTADAASLVNGVMFAMSRKETVPIASQKLVTRFFFQKPTTVSSSDVDYVPFEVGNFTYPLEKVVWVDLEGDTGKHSGGRTVSELLLIVEEHLRKRVRHIPHKVSIIVPALNEAKTVTTVLRELKELQFDDHGLDKEIILVDGGSSDNTFALAQAEPGVRAFQLGAVHGRGMALRYGLNVARGDIVVFFPSDGEYSVTDLPRVIAPLMNQEFPIVFGSRAFGHDLSGTLERIYGKRGVMVAVSKYGGMLLSILTLSLYHRIIGDPLTSVKGFNARLFRQMSFVRTGVDFDMELIAKLLRGKYPILEVPVSYKARTIQEGKKITIGDGIKSVITLLRFSRYRLKPQKKISGANAYAEKPDYA
jgi:2-phospho-L-lactate transferase/gluconeogenesis factor (CofD/UPF0052 family)